MNGGRKIDGSLRERRAILELLERLKDDAVSFEEMERIGARFRQAGARALRPLLRELEREQSGERITRYAYILDFFATECWLERLMEIAMTRRDLGDDGKTALLVALEGYGVDVQTAAFHGAFSPAGSPLCGALVGAGKLAEEGIISFLDDFLACQTEVQKMVIAELAKGAEPQGIRMLEAILWHEEREIVQSALAALGRIRHPLAAGVLARYLLDGDPALSGESRKNLRRLSFLGIAPPPAGAALPFHAGYASAPDCDGYRSLLVSRWQEGAKIETLYLQVHERRGLLAAWGAERLSEEEFERELEAFSLQDDLHQVPPGHVLELLRDALYRSTDLSYLPADFYLRRGMFAGEDLTPAPYRPSFPEYAPLRGLSYQGGEEICRELFADPFFAGRLAPAKRVYDLAEEYRRCEAGEPVLERVCTEFLGPDLELIRERLLSSADLLRRCGKDGGLARKVVALAESLAGNPLPHHLHPFLRGLAAESVESARAVLARDQQLPAVPSI